MSATMTDEEYAPADTSSSLSDAPSSSPAPIPSASPKPSPAPSNSPAPGSKLNHFLNNSIVYPSIIGSCRGENGKGSFLDVGESASGRFKRLSSTLVYQPAVVHPREDWGKLESIDPLVYNIAHPAQQHKEIARKVPRSDGFAAFDANSKSTVSWQGHCALLMQLLQEIDGNHFTSGEALTRLLVMSSYGMTDIYVAHQYPIEIWNDESFANDPSLGTPDDSTARRYEPKLPDGMAVRGPVPDDGKATSRAGSPMVIDSTDQSGPPSRHVSPVVQPKHSTPPPPATPKTPKTPKNPPANPQSVGATPLAKLKITSSFPSPKPKDQSNSRAGNAPVIVRTDIPPDIEGALYVRKNRVPAPDKRAAKKTAQDLGTCAKEMTVEPAQWGLPVAGEPEFAHLPTSKTWASFVPAGLMSPRQWDDARNAVVDAFRPQPVAGRSREERMEKRNRKWEDQ